MKTIYARFIALILLVILAGCGGGSSGSGSSGSTAAPTSTTPTLVSLAITPVNPTIAIGLNQQFVATGTYSDGTTADLSKSAKWTSGGSGVSILYTSGLATGKTAGFETVTATVGAVSDTTKLTVKAPFTAVSAGGYHTVALKVDGTLFAWGENRAGQLGEGTYSVKSAPTMVGTLKTWTMISSGEFHTVAVRADGTLWAWGSNQFGQLGDGTNTDKPTPIKIGTATTWVAVSAGQTHTVAVKKDGTLWAWGGNASGQLGDGTLKPSPIPVKTGKLGKFYTDWTAVSAGSHHTIGRRADGTIWSWGQNTNGQLGQGSRTDVWEPTPIILTGGDRWVSMSAGGDHTLAIRSDGKLFAWGLNGSNQLGIELRGGDVLTPTQVGDETRWAIVTAGAQHSLAVKSDGTLWAWGSNSEGQLGDGTTDEQWPPKQIGTETTWLSISAGKLHSFAFKTDGTLWGWGRNLEGQQGNGTLTSPVLVPTKLP